MAIINGFKRSLQFIGTQLQGMVRFVLSGVVRLFSPTDDNYPATGVQPYEGEPGDSSQ
ncbi:MAG: hypothetical protein WCD18_04075 [Thermosynechococcaceae cyanobacterium]